MHYMLQAAFLFFNDSVTSYVNAWIYPQNSQFSDHSNSLTKLLHDIVWNVEIRICMLHVIVIFHLLH